ncbi:unnamed protein product [Larinioides sclopetarius]|uniref:LIM zinc-binding domain-containing protein n=1 Tax=Larinioides sclopetarius TaxID=280406 RepID=A0AAV2ARZ7_9ARAC
MFRGDQREGLPSGQPQLPPEMFRLRTLLKVAPQCARCKKPISPPSYTNEVTRVLAMGNSYHTTCYRCEDCGLPLSSNSDGRGCYPLNDRLYCFDCHKRRAPNVAKMAPKK